jgi:hypothetical protein
MDIIWQSLFRKAVVGFFLGTGVGLVTGVVVLGNPWQEAIGIALGTGIGLAVVFYTLRP